MLLPIRNKERKVYIYVRLLIFKKKMVNWKLLGIAGLAYLASWGCNDLVNSRMGYDNLGRGARGGDKVLERVVRTMRPMSNKLQELVHTNELAYREPHLENNQYKIEQGAEDVAGYMQLASLLAGGLALFNVGKRKR